MNVNDCTLLLVEDNPGDIRLVQESLAESGLEIQLEIARNGSEALEMLGLQADHSTGVHPDLILLDLNLPILSGHQVLTMIKHNNKTRSIPVVVFSTSDAEKDILESYDNYANCYITKPATLDGYLNVIPRIFSFWFSRVQLPGGN